MTEQKGLFYNEQSCLIGVDSNISNIHYENSPLQYTKIFVSVEIGKCLLFLLKTLITGTSRTASQGRF